MDKKQEKKIWNSQLAIENPKNDRIAVIYSVKVSSVRILEKPRNPKNGHPALLTTSCRSILRQHTI